MRRLFLAGVRMAAKLELLIAQTILQGFDAQYGRFLEVTAGAQQRFEQADWPAVQQAMKSASICTTITSARWWSSSNASPGRNTSTPTSPAGSKQSISTCCRTIRVSRSPKAFNSVYCRLFKHRDLTPDKLFVFSSQPERRFRDIPRPLARDFTPHGDLPAMLRSVLSDLPLRLLWEDLTRDIRYITQALQRAFSAQQLAGATFQIANELFYRNKAAAGRQAAPGRRRLSVLAAYPPQRIGRAVYRRLPDR